MADLVAILDARSQDYAQAESELDTAGRTVEQSAEDLYKRVAEWTK
jgi:XRE family aerobic/anaerobic benzoate catabolism transcriptional regulator